MSFEPLFSYDSVGLIGVALYICAYAALQLGFIRGSGYAYTIMNLFAAAFVLVSLTNDFNLSSAIIQITWITISVVGLARTYYLHYTIRLNEDEAELIESKLPRMSKHMARSFLDAGQWFDAETGYVLCTEGAPVGGLIYLMNGVADVSVTGEPVGQCLSATFIGELTCFDAGPATATVVTSSPARFFKISTEALNRLCARNADIRVVLESAIGNDTRTKLVAANQRLSEMRPAT